MIFINLLCTIHIKINKLAAYGFTNIWIILLFIFCLPTKVEFFLYPESSICCINSLICCMSIQEEDLVNGQSATK